MHTSWRRVSQTCFLVECVTSAVIVLFKNILAFQSVRKVPEFYQSYHGAVISCDVCWLCFTKWFELWSLRINREPWLVTWKLQRRMFLRCCLLGQKNFLRGNPAAYQKLSGSIISVILFIANMRSLQHCCQLIKYTFRLIYNIPCFHSISVISIIGY